MGLQGLQTCCVRVHDSCSGTSGNSPDWADFPEELENGHDPIVIRAGERKCWTFRMEFEDSANCGANNPNTQTAVFTTKLLVCEPGAFIRFKATGKVERQDGRYDFIILWLDP